MSASPSSTPKLSPNVWDRTLNTFQAWALTHPTAIFSKLLLPPLSFIEGLVANQPPYLDYKQRIFGNAFCCAGQVVLGDFDVLETALTSPQARTWRLGTSLLSAAHGPGPDLGGRNTFLISLSDADAGGQDHPAFRQCIEQYIFTDAALARQSDPIAQQLLDQLATDYIEMPHDAKGTFDKDNQRGLKGFFVRYLHYVLFQIPPDDADAIATLTQLHYTNNGTLHYFTGSGLLETLLPFMFGKIPTLIEEVATIYEQSPVLADFREQDPEFNHLTRRELARLLVSLMSIAALQGPLHLAKTAMGCWPIPEFLDKGTSKIQTTRYWDALDLEDRDAVQRYLLECGRLFMPVSHTHHVATEPFTVTLAGQERTFPTDTVILIPMLLGMLSEDFWGPTAYEINPDRENLCPYHMGFHSVGDRHAGRICPGRTIALTMLIDMLRVVGQARRAQANP